MINKIHIICYNINIFSILFLNIINSTDFYIFCSCFWSHDIPIDSISDGIDHQRFLSHPIRYIKLFSFHICINFRSFGIKFNWIFMIKSKLCILYTCNIYRDYIYDINNSLLLLRKDRKKNLN